MKTIYQAIVDAMDKGESVALVTIIHVKGSSPASLSSKMLVWRDGKTSGTVGGGCLENDVRLAALDCIDSGSSRTMDITLSRAHAADGGLQCGGVVTLFIEALDTPKLLIFGGGHISSEISRLAKALGFFVCIVDDREKYVNQDRFPEADETVAMAFEDYVKTERACANAYIVIVTRGHEYDGLCLEWALQQDAKYIGMIGSSTKRELIYDDLKTRGVSDDDLRRVSCPVGLDIGAETRQEIGVSIAAELIKIRRRG